MATFDLSFESDMTPGENLRRVRQYLGLRQSQVTGETITRNLISLIENNKTPLNEHVAKVVSQNMNAHLAKDQDLFIFPDDILYPERIDAKQVADDWIKELERRLSLNQPHLEDEEIILLEKFLQKWDIKDKQAKIYKLLSDIYRMKDKDAELFFLFKALDSYLSFIHTFDDHRIYRLFMQMVENSVHRGKYREAIRLCDFSLKSTEALPSHIEAELLYFKALSYKKSGRLQESLSLIKGVIRSGRGCPNIQSKALWLKGVCLVLMGMEDEGEITLHQALALIHETDQDDLLDVRVRVHLELLELYRAKKDLAGVKQVKEELVPLLCKVEKLEDSSMSPEVLYQALGKAHLLLREFSEGEEYFTAAYQSAKTKGKISEMIAGGIGILDLCMTDLRVEQEALQGLLKIPEQIFSERSNQADQWEKNRVQDEERNKLGTKLARFYLSKNHYSGAVSVLEQMDAHQRP